MNYQDISNVICHLVGQRNNWSSTVIILRVMHFSTSVLPQWENHHLLLTVQLISLLYIIEESLHHSINLIHTYLTKIHGQNSRICLQKLDVSVDVHWRQIMWIRYLVIKKASCTLCWSHGVKWKSEGSSILNGDDIGPNNVVAVWRKPGWVKKLLDVTS